MPSHRHQKYSRRSFLQRSTALASAGALGSSRPLPAAQAASSPASLREPRLLFNDDANLLYFAPYPMERQALANYVRLMAESGVDAFSWDVCVNGVCWYASKVGPVVGDGLDPIPDYSVYHLRNNILHLAHKQADPPAAVAEECHRYGMRMLAAFRMGLHIFSSYEPGQGQSVYHNPRANRLTDKTIHQFPPVDNVWWRKGWARPGQTLDWAHSEVRELIMAPLREIAEGYDIDGVELNFIRGNIWFDADTAVTEAPLMTAMLGQIRQVLDQAGARRREPRRLLAVRLPDDLAACRRFGLDVPAWVEQGLVDVIMPSQVHGVDFDARVEDFAKLCAGKPIRLLPTIQPGQPPFTYSATEEFARRAYTLPQLRGLVDSWYRNGATGISTFNFQHRRSDVVSCKESVAWLKELADATKIARAERHYPLYGANVSWAASEVGVRKAIPIPDRKSVV